MIQSTLMKTSLESTPARLPDRMRPFFQEYDLEDIQITRDADLIIQRLLDEGDWEDARWLFQQYGKVRVRRFLIERGERWLQPVVFNYWRKLLGIRKWNKSPFQTSRKDVWIR